MPDVPPPRRPAWRALLVWGIAVSAVSVVVGVPFMAVRALRLDADTACLRETVAGVWHDGQLEGWSPRVEVRLGGCLLGLARVVARCSDAPDEVRHALSAARAASVGVYQWRGDDVAGLRSRLAGGAATIEAGGRSWVRVVAVRDDEDSVAVFTPVEAEGEAMLELFVLVVTGDELVVASVELDPAPISALLAPHLREARRAMRSRG